MALNRDTNLHIAGILETISDGFQAFDRGWRYTYLNSRAERILGRKREELLGKVCWEEYPEAVDSCFYHKHQEAMRTQTPVVFEDFCPHQQTWLEFSLYPSADGLAVYARDVTERKRAEEQLKARVHQQEAVAQLGLRALSGTDLGAVLDEAVHRAAQALNVELCKVLQLLPGGREVLLVAGIGWEEGLVGNARVSTGTNSQAGYTLVRREPVIVEDLRTEKRFSGPPLLHEHGVVSGISCIIHGREGPWGVLGAHTRERRAFTRDDTNFLQAIANVLATAIERKQTEEEQRTFLRDVLRSVTEGKLTLCGSREELPARLPPFGQTIVLTEGSLRATRLQAGDAATVQGFSNERCNDLLTAVAEAAMNAVVHAGGGTATMGTAPSGTVQVWVEDQGGGIDISRLPRATLERGFSSAGGLGHGFWLILKTVDRVWLLTGPEWTTVVLEQDTLPSEPGWLGAR